MCVWRAGWAGLRTEPARGRASHKGFKDNQIVQVRSTGGVEFDNVNRPQLEMIPLACGEPDAVHARGTIQHRSARRQHYVETRDNAPGVVGGGPVGGRESE